MVALPFETEQNDDGQLTNALNMATFVYKLGELWCSNSGETFAYFLYLCVKNSKKYIALPESLPSGLK